MSIHDNDSLVSEDAAGGARAVLACDLAEATHAMFEHYGCTLEEGTGDGNNELVTVIGYSGDELRGALGLSVSNELLESLHIAMLGQPGTQRQHVDLLGELSNQLLGRIKTILGRYALTITITTPMVLRGVKVTVYGVPQLIEQSYVTDRGAVHIWLDAEIQDGLELVEVAEEEMTSGMMCSEMFMF